MRDQAAAADAVAEGGGAGGEARGCCGVGRGTATATAWLLAGGADGGGGATSAPNVAQKLPLAPGAEQVLLAVSPFAPLTTAPMPYTLTVTAG